MPAFDPSSPTTELEAVNTMMVSIGQPPLPDSTDLTTATNADIVLAVNTLAKVTREVLSGGWRFNTLFGWEVLPTATYVWTDNDGEETTLNVFKKPSGALSWKQTMCWENDGLDLVERLSIGYQETGENVLVLFDRNWNRDGADSERYESVYLDMTMAMNFEQMPETARRYVAILAARRFSDQTIGSPELRVFTQQDEMAALRLLQREQGLLEKFNLLSSPEGWGWGGGRLLQVGGPSRIVRRGGS